MSSSENEGEIKISQTEVTITKTETSLNEKLLDKVIVKDITKIGRGMVQSLGGFRTFILRGNVVDLAIGIVIGAAFTSVVTALVSDIITPLIPVSGTASLATWTIVIPHTYIKAILIGPFINAIISFLIVAAVLYFFVVQPVNSLMKLYHKNGEEEPTTCECPYCFQPINLKATRCPFCTSVLPTEDKKAGTKKESELILISPDALEKLSDKLAESIAKKATITLEKGPDGTTEVAVQTKE
ncbi:MAG TPA: large conductance mechanosensitive channel protein MscL [Ktedonobacteraceae bacterium]